MNQPHFQLLSRNNCCLCEDARAAVDSLARRGQCTWEIVDVDRDKALLVRYGQDVPVLLAAGEVVGKHSITVQALEDFLGGKRAAGGGL